MRRITGALIIGLALLSQSSTVAALGFGRISNSTVLGQQLEFSVVLTTDAGEAVSADCIVAEVVAGDNPISPSLVRTRVDTPVDGGPAVLRVVTNVRIDEPVASINVTVGCPARLSRKFVVFIDPPVILALPGVAVPALPASGAAVATGVPDSTVNTSPLTAGPPGPSPAGRAPLRAQAPAAVPPRRAVARAPRFVEGRAPRAAAASLEPKRVTAQAPRRSSVSVAAAPAAQATPRLKLEAELPTYRPAASAPGVPPPPAADAASGARATDGSLLAEAEQLRIQLLEQNIQKLLTEAKATQASMAAMQARLREAEASRFSNPLIYALLGLIALLLALLLLLMWRQSKLKRESSWWVAGGDAAAAAAAAPAAVPVAEPEPEALSRPAMLESSAALPAMQLDQLRNLAQATPQTFVVDGAATRDPMATVPGEQARDMSVEELIDMEQQAEFFIVLGQDDAAIDLLMGHVRNGGSTSPLAFLKLLEIYRRRAEREPYDRVRERFNRRFNAYAPDWESGGTPGQALEDYPQVVAQLQAVWPDPPQAMGVLESLLFRRDASAGTFDLPAYGELLFLYSQARDLADSDVSPDAVDLLLPLGEDLDFTMPRSTEPVPLGSTRPAAPNGSRAPTSIDFDLDLDLPATPARK